MLFLSKYTEGLRHSMEKWIVEKTMRNRNHRKYVENDEYNTECALRAVMLDGEISKYVDTYFSRSYTGMYVVAQPIQDIYIYIYILTT